MKDPERPSQGEAGGLGRELLDAARDEQPSLELQARMARGLGLPGIPSAPPNAPPPVQAVAAPGGSIGTVVGVSAGVVAVVVAGVVAFRVLSPAPSPEAPMPAPPAVTTPAAPTTATTAPATSDQIREEIRLLDAVRAALKAGAPRSALGHLDGYDKRFPHGTFGPEAATLRIEALVRDGQVQQAAGLAARFRAAHPDSPLLKRIDRLTAADRR